jgi:hypothetical protein
VPSDILSIPLAANELRAKRRSTPDISPAARRARDSGLPEASDASFLIYKEARLPTVPAQLPRSGRRIG